MKQLSVALALALALAACAKKEEPKKDPTPTTKKEPAPPTAKDPTPPPVDKDPAAKDPEPTPDPDADFIKVTASHAKPKPSDPDVFQITAFKVVKADFDPAKVEGGTADLELDLASLASNSERRDSDIKGPDYLDVEKFSVVTIHLDNVKKTADNEYSADATVNAHGVEKKLPVAFQVLDTTADSIRIKGSNTFKRLDFKIGGPEGEDSVGSDITIEMQLTLHKTA
jgi:polyisoprenoid-binding protein YceI